MAGPIFASAPLLQECNLPISAKQAVPDKTLTERTHQLCGSTVFDILLRGVALLLCRHLVLVSLLHILHQLMEMSPAQRPELCLQHPRGWLCIEKVLRQACNHKISVCQMCTTDSKLLLA